MSLDIANVNEKFRKLYESTTNGIAIYLSTDGQRFELIGMNPAAERMRGVKFEAIAGKEVREVFPGVVDIGFYDVLKSVWTTGVAAELPAALYDDKRIVQYYANRVYKISELEIAAVCTDVTEQKIAEDELRKSEARFRMLFERAADPSLLIIGNTFVDCNQATVDILGAGSKEKVLNLHPSALSPPCQPDGRLSSEKADEMISVAVQTGSHRFEWAHRRMNGEVFPVEVSLTLIQEGGESILFTVWRDISERKKAEEDRRNLERQLLHTQKLESLGVLAGGIAHDFNNILTTIIGNVDLALMRLNPESPVLDNLHNISTAAFRAADLAKQMLAYSGKGKFVVEPLDVNRLLEEMLHMLEVSISKKAVLRLNLHKQLPAVEADATQIRQIIMNLVINASEAIGDRSGVIAITTGCMDCDCQYLKNIWLEKNLSDGLYVYLEVADTGCGMDQETLAKLFDPFFTTKFTGRGLGMSAVLGIVRGHKGAIKVYSEPGKGTTFKVLLPTSDKPAELFNHKKHADDWKGSGTVLLVDDEETIRGIGAAMLKELGFSTITANNGREGVEMFRQNPEIAFVILDLTMPHMDGEQCFRELRMLKSDVKVIMSSGYNEQEVAQKFVGKGLAGFIQKPYRLSDLKMVIREL